MKKIFPITVLTLGMMGNHTAWAQQKLVLPQSEISFTSKQMGVPVEGKFRFFDAQLTFDPKKPEAAKINFKIDLSSVSVGGPETEVEIAKAEWFNTKAFPVATFESTRVSAVSKDKLSVSGKLTIKGIMREILVPVVLTQSGTTTSATGMFVLKRLEFNLGNTDWKDTSLVADEVPVKFKLALSGVASL
jgi:polyisoprenoid-binding protein YceI